MQDVNFTWPQGEDLIIELRYKEGPNQNRAVPVDLTGGYTARMTIANPGSPQTPLLVLDSTPEFGGIVLLSGNNEPNIRITLSRTHTLSGGPFAAGGGFGYDLFLRNSQNVQVKILEGIINVRRSYTQWA